MIARGICDHAVRESFSSQREDHVRRTANLERSAALEVLALEPRANAGLVVEARGGHHRRAVDDPGDPGGSYSEQMTHALINEFVIHADAYIDLHGGDLPEALVPFVICRSDAGLADSKARGVAARSKEIAMAFGLPYVLTVSKPVQTSKGQSSYAAAA